MDIFGKFCVYLHQIFFYSTLQPYNDSCSVRAMISSCTSFPSSVKYAVYPATRMRSPLYSSGLSYAASKVSLSITLNRTWKIPRLHILLRSAIICMIPFSLFNISGSIFIFRRVPCTNLSCGRCDTDFNTAPGPSVSVLPFGLTPSANGFHACLPDGNAPTSRPNGVLPDTGNIPGVIVPNLLL